MSWKVRLILQPCTVTSLITTKVAKVAMRNTQNPNLEPPNRLPTPNPTIVVQSRAKPIFERK